MSAERLRRLLHWDRCVECGECLVRCRYLELTRERAVEEMAAINRGQRASSLLLERCVSCMSCNAFCPRDAHPYERIQQQRHRRLQREGVPVRAAYLMPGGGRDFRSDLRPSAEERALLERWDAPDPPGDTVLFPGCNLRTMPLLATGTLFDGLPVWGGGNVCCGEMHYRIGALDTVERTARTLTRTFRDRGIEEMVFVCPACFNMFRNVLPRQFGARFDFRITFFDRWLQRRIHRRELTFDGSLEGRVVVHDSCHGRVLGRDFMERQRALLRRCGLTVHSAAADPDEGLCCGIAAGAARFSALDLARTSLRAARANQRADGDEVAAYCTGCVLTLGCTRLLSPYRKPVRHLLEYLHEALGEPVHRRQSTPGTRLMLNILRHSLPRYLDPRRVPLD